MAEKGIIKTVKPLLSGITYVLVKYTVVKLTPNNAPINVNPAGGGWVECGQGVVIWQILKFFDQIPQGGKRKVNKKCQKRPHPRGKI